MFYLKRFGTDSTRPCEPPISLSIKGDKDDNGVLFYKKYMEMVIIFYI